MSGVRMEVQSAPKFKTTLKHGPSGSEIVTEAPKDNGGTGMSFSPTDLCAASLAACAVTTMALAASREGIPLGEVSASVEKIMTATAPRKIAELKVEIRMPRGLDAKHRERMEQAAHGCPVRLSLHPDVKVSESFVYAD